MQQPYDVFYYEAKYIYLFPVKYLACSLAAIVPAMNLSYGGFFYIGYPFKTRYARARRVTALTEIERIVLPDFMRYGSVPYTKDHGVYSILLAQQPLKSRLHISLGINIYNLPCSRKHHRIVVPINPRSDH